MDGSDVEDLDAYDDFAEKLTVTSVGQSAAI